MTQSDDLTEPRPEQADATAAVRRTLLDCLAVIDGLGYNLAGARLQSAIDSLPGALGGFEENNHITS